MECPRAGQGRPGQEVVGPILVSGAGSGGALAVGWKREGCQNVLGCLPPPGFVSIAVSVAVCVLLGSW